MSARPNPLLVVVKLLAIVFVAEAGIMFLLPLIVPAQTSPPLVAFIDSCLLSLITAPLIWWVIIGPVRASANAEKLAAVAQIATGVAHELRNPLTSVKMLVQHQREGLLPSDPMDEDLRIIEDEIRRMERSIQAFLDFGRPRRPETRRIELSQLVERAFQLLSVRAANQQVALELKPSAAAMVDADPEQVLQVILNLLLNALDVMPSGGVIVVGLECRDSQARLTFDDSGPGIAPEVQRKLFQPFVTNKETGMGLGLMVCKGIVEAHRGRLWAENRESGGARFVLDLPLSDSSNIDTADSAAPAAGRAEAG